MATRGHFLRGSGTMIALPALESIGFATFGWAIDKTPVVPSS
jgi:hypothetical protein